MITILITVQKYRLNLYCASFSSTFFQNCFKEHVLALGVGAFAKAKSNCNLSST